MRMCRQTPQSCAQQLPRSVNNGSCRHQVWEVNIPNPAHSNCQDLQPTAATDIKVWDAWQRPITHPRTRHLSRHDPRSPTVEDARSEMPTDYQNYGTRYLRMTFVWEDYLEIGTLEIVKKVRLFSYQYFCTVTTTEVPTPLPKHWLLC